jgi:hypothetical protein
MLTIGRMLLEVAFQTATACTAPRISESSPFV